MKAIISSNGGVGGGGDSRRQEPGCSMVQPLGTARRVVGGAVHREGLLHAEQSWTALQALAWHALAMGWHFFSLELQG